MSAVDAPRVVVMGVSGCGKSTVGALLAAALDVPFVDADGLHPAANIAKMRAGTPLTDEDRWPWLDAVAGVLGAGDRGVVVACSALRRPYRDLLRRGAPGATFLHLDGGKDVLAARMAARDGHFMPPGLLDSQLATLEPLGADEDGLVLAVDAPADRIAAAAGAWLS